MLNYAVISAPMKPSCLFLSVLLLSGLPACAAFQDVFLIGTDNATQSEFEQENAALAHYYWENGNYSALGGENWASGQEVWNNGVAGDALGFPRAFTTGYTQTNVYFQLAAAEAAPNQPVRITLDLIALGGGSVHDLDVRLNAGAPFAAQTGIAAAQTWVINTTAGAIGAVAGSNVLRLRRTGGAGGASPWIQLDYLRMEVDTAPQFINAFTVSDWLLRPGETTTLNWTLLEPAATVSINQGIGDVTALTTGGVGSVSVSPSVNTTYTLTATFNSQSQTKQVTVQTTTWEGIFEAGKDDGSNAEFSHEVAADDDYYFAGDYTSVGGPNQAANELLNDDTDTNTPAGRTGNSAIGFERAVVESDPHTNLWFVPQAGQVSVTARHRITVDVNSVGSAGGSAGTHDLQILLNDKLLRTETGITGPRLVQFEVTGLTSGLTAGPNKLTLRRTGGTLAGYIIFDYVMMEYLPGASPPVVTVTDDSILGTHTVSWTSASGKTYRVQKSADAGGSWTDLAAGFPLGGAPSTSLFFEDRITPHTDPKPDYRVLLE